MESKIWNPIIFTCLLMSAFLITETGHADSCAERYLLEGKFTSLSPYKTFKKSKKTEEDKVDYLLNLIEMSKVRFWRNGKTYDGEDAADFLRMKWARYGEDDFTAKDFVERIASASSRSGRPYNLVYPDEVMCLSKEIFSKELSRLSDTTGKK